MIEKIDIWDNMIEQTIWSTYPLKWEKIEGNRSSSCLSKEDNMQKASLA